MPYAEPDRLVVANELNPAGSRITLAWPNYVDLRDRAQSYESFTCHQASGYTIVGLDKPRRLDGRQICWNFFDLLGIRPQLGRTFTTDDDRPGATPVAIVSDRFWKNDLAGDPAVLGGQVRMNDQIYTIVGVLPPTFRWGRPEDVYTPVGLALVPNSSLLDRGNHIGLFAIGRLRPGVDVEQARDEAQRIAADLARTYPSTNSGNGVEVDLLRGRRVEQVRDTLVMLMGAVGFLLLLACVNVANLLVARGAARQHELAIRTALGGSRWRLVRQLLAESALLSVAGGALGVALAYWLTKVLVSLAPANVPRVDDVGLNGLSLLFALGAAIACGLLFGAFPALHASGARGQHLLARASRTSAAVSPHRTRRVLMVVEVALALVLLTGCGLMARTMMQLHAVDSGIRPEQLLTARVTLTGTAWSPERRRAFYDVLLARLRALPGVTGAGLTLSLPIEGSQWGSVFIARDKPVPPRAELPTAAWIPISAGYMETAGMRLVGGRTFNDTDRETSAFVTVVNETLARRLWPGEDPIGKQVKQGWPEWTTPWREVIGVVADVKLEGVERDTPMQAYLPLHQDPSRNVALVLRTAGPPLGLAAALERAVQEIDSTLPVTRVLAMSGLMTTALARQRLSMVVLGVFAVVAMLVAAVGLYGVVSHNVTERTREIGVRMALGAGERQVLGLFVRQGLLTTAAGVAIGVGGALVLARGLRTLLFGIEPGDPVTLAGVVLILLVVASIACYLPARRAARIDPLLALRSE
jgi:putative ABC transport system permease protein